jgi:hypothetical protein
MSYIDVETTVRGVRMIFVNIDSVENVKTGLSKEILSNMCSLNKDGHVTVTLRDNRVWSMSCLPEYKPEYAQQAVYPIRNWDNLPVLTNEELYAKIELIVNG